MATDAEVRTAPSPLLSDVCLPALAAPRWKSRFVWAMCSVIVLAIAIAALARRGARPPRYITQEITTGSLLVSVTATGNLESRNQVDIGSELSGTVRAVHVDVNGRVSAGQVLAVLDTSRLEAQLLQAESGLQSAEARVIQSDARLREARANYARLQKARELSGKKLPSQQDLGVAEAAAARAEGEGAGARAAVAQSRATLDTIRADLAKTAIRSPMNGVVLVRSIEPGQTVAASLQAPVLFTLAEDLRKMELHVAVDEADIGSVKVGQQGRFSVDAFPAHAFSGRVTRIHLASNNTRSAAATGGNEAGNQSSASSTGVVTYETVLEVDNTELMLRPGMTATAEIVTSRIDGATLVPNAAMRFTPQDGEFPGRDDDIERGSGMMALMPYMADRWKCPRENGQRLGCVWLLEKGRPALAIFKPGATDRSVTQVLMLRQLPNWSSLSHIRKDPILIRAVARKLMPGMQVIVDSAQPPSN